ncbi:MAG: 3-oxoacyl-ACP reductase FabG [Clostridia bacterium]|nr:3-oxoacyl-ACP reductase FabG [Clostridia bacterium]
MRKILITGGSRGIGAACVRKFAHEGAAVCFVYKNSRAEAQKLAEETGAAPICADLADKEQASDAVKKAAEIMGGIDVLVNNAGVCHFSLFTDESDSQIDEILSANLTSAMICAREAAKFMVAQHCGRIINVSSVWGICGSSCEALYSTSKAGLIGLTKALAKELGPSGITVNCIAPGVIDTDMNSSLTPETLEALADETPLCRIGRPQEVAELAFFLSSEKAAFITGQTIAIDGGFAL